MTLVPSVPQGQPIVKPFEMAHMYLRGVITPQEAVQELQDTGAYGKYTAAEISLDAAANGFADTEQHFFNAVEQYSNAARFSEVLEDAQRTQGVHSARIRLAQLPLLYSVLIDKELPPAAVTQQSYTASLVAAKGIHQVINACRTKETLDTRNLMIGVAAETAVTLLGQRYALRQDIADAWLPLKTPISRDYSTERRSRKIPNSAWDISVWSQALGDAPEEAYKIQVKNTYPLGREKRRIAKGVLPLYLFPDLKLDNLNTKRDSQIILKELVDEAWETEGGPIGSSLDLRTHKLLSLLDTTDVSEKRMQATVIDLR